MGYEYIDHPDHYGGKDNVYEAIKVIQAWDLDFELGSAVKYIERAGKKPGESTLRDLRKALTYIQFEIDKIEARLYSDETFSDAQKKAAAELVFAQLEEKQRCFEVTRITNGG